MFGNVSKHDLSCLIFYFNTISEHSYLLGRESLVCSLSWPHSPPLPSPPFCGIWHYYQRGIMDRLWLFRCISLCALSSFLYLRKALKQPAVDEGFYFFASNSNLPHTIPILTVIAFSLFNLFKFYFLVATCNNFSVSPIYSFTAFD